MGTAGLGSRFLVALLRRCPGDAAAWGHRCALFHGAALATLDASASGLGKIVLVVVHRNQPHQHAERNRNLLAIKTRNVQHTQRHKRFTGISFRCEIYNFLKFYR